jgi:hypothetical protein
MMSDHMSEALAEMGGVREAGWRPLTEYEPSMQLVQVLCKVTEPELSEFPRACELPISAGDYGIDDMFVSIGWQDEDGIWFVAGWDMMQDCWKDAKCFKVKSFQPIAAIEPAPVNAREAARVLLDGLNDASELDDIIQVAMQDEADADGTEEWVFVLRAALRAIAEGKDDE